MTSFKRIATVVLTTAALLSANSVTAASNSKPASRASASASSAKRMSPPSQSSGRSFGGFGSGSSSATKAAPKPTPYIAPSSSSTASAAPAPSKRIFGSFGTASTTNSQRAPSVSSDVNRDAQVAPAPATKSSFGRFGPQNMSATATQTPPTPLPKSTSALSNSLDKSAVQANALQAYDRNAAAKKAALAAGAGVATGAVVATTMSNNEQEKVAAASTATPQSSPNAHVGKTQSYNPPVAQQAPPVVVHQQRSDDSLLWYSLGQASARQSPTVQQDRSYERRVENSAPASNGPVTAANASIAPTVGAAPVKTNSSSGFGFFSVILVMALIGAGVWYYLQRQKALKAALPKRNYSI